MRSKHIQDRQNPSYFGYFRPLQSLEVFSCPHGGRGKYFGRTYTRKNDQPLFEESLQTSRDSLEWDYDSNKSWDNPLDSPKSGVSFFSCPAGGRDKYFGGFFSCPHGGRGKYFGFFLSVRTVVGGNILDVRILEELTKHFSRNPYKRRGILSDGVITRTSPGTFG